jgi:glutathione S-transferase
MTWDELAAASADVLGRHDYANGPPTSQSRLRLFGQPASSVRVTLYRDNHAWCPYCQRVWLWLEEMRVPYRVEKVTLRMYGVKEDWYLALVPSGNVPAVALDGRIVEGSDLIIDALEAQFGALNGLPLRSASSAKLLEVLAALWGAWDQYMHLPARSAAEETVRKRKLDKSMALLDRLLAVKEGPWLLEQLSAADLFFAPMLERVEATCYYFKGLLVREGGYAHLDRWFAALYQREPYVASMGDYHTQCHVVPALFGACYESGDAEQQRCRRAVDEGPFLEVRQLRWIPAPPDAALFCLARSVKHHNSILKQEPQRSGDSDGAFRCALTLLATGVKVQPPRGTHPSLRYIRDRTSAPRDFPPYSTALFRHVCEEISEMDGEQCGTPIPVKHRFDQEPFAFIKAKQEVQLEAYSRGGGACNAAESTRQNQHR